ncbi:CdaR family protein [Secundilactobacillus mixtipabuli]|uniref:Cell surface protein n=1 Tax=Secundilactobacillus mixtipabuli TaxID=1435342 RepID=A0A1Z5IDA6_9LACO|nr:CdaR family protein [Secundilactobacillus mixtipabuli]GAW99746.1 cell surface protein [Secundilactobacillus mixtipabuli]
MKKIFDSRWTYRLISLFLAVCLFLYVNSSKSLSTQQTGSTTGTNSTTLTATEQKTVSVQLRLNVDSDKYFVTGYPEKVKVHLRGPAALVTATANTQNFRVFANLTGLKAGEHTVKLKQDGLNRDINYQISPASIKVNIQPRQTVSFPVSVQYDKSRIAANYIAGSPTSDVTNVKATGAEGEIDRITKVVAQLNLAQDTKKSVNTEAVIEALDRNGQTVNVILTPATTQVNLPITAKGNSKKVPLKFKAKNANSNQEYSFQSSTKTVQVFGSASDLKAISEFSADVDVSDVKNQKTKTISLDAEANKVTGTEPGSVKVTITTESK